MEPKLLVLDGGMGHLLKAKGVGRLCKDLEFEELFAATALANEHLPELVQEVHAQYIDAGADVITTNSFGCTEWLLTKVGRPELALRLTEEAGKLAREAADRAGREVLVAGAPPAQLAPPSRPPSRQRPRSRVPPRVAPCAPTPTPPTHPPSHPALPAARRLPASAAGELPGRGPRPSGAAAASLPQCCSSASAARGPPALRDGVGSAGGAGRRDRRQRIRPALVDQLQLGGQRERPAAQRGRAAGERGRGAVASSGGSSGGSGSGAGLVVPNGRRAGLGGDIHAHICVPALG